MEYKEKYGKFSWDIEYERINCAIITPVTKYYTLLLPSSFINLLYLLHILTPILLVTINVIDMGYHCLHVKLILFTNMINYIVAIIFVFFLTYSENYKEIFTNSYSFLYLQLFSRLVPC